jgi:hypothetical protein
LGFSEYNDLMRGITMKKLVWAILLLNLCLTFTSIAQDEAPQYPNVYMRGQDFPIVMKK